MKKIIINALTMVFLMIGITVAANLLAHNPTVELTKDTKDQLTKMNLIDIKKTDCVQINDNQCEYKMYQTMFREEKNESNHTIYIPYKYHLGSHKIPLNNCSLFNNTILNDTITFGGCIQYTDYTELQLQALIEQDIKTWLEKFSKISIQRETTYNNIKVSAGDVTTKQIK